MTGRPRRRPPGCLSHHAAIAIETVASAETAEAAIKMSLGSGMVSPPWLVSRARSAICHPRAPNAHNRIFSVKAGKTGASHVRDLRGVIEREADSGAAIGVLVSLQKPTKPMRVEAASAGFYASPFGTRHPKIQLLTIEQLLAGGRVDYPPTRAEQTFKRAPKAGGPKPEQLLLRRLKVSSLPPGRRQGRPRSVSAARATPRSRPPRRLRR